ncbi:AAA family ATPase [Actinomyces wuliandei]|uniref:AAA family ATPase n=1 Tax=Actinomyces wuliandei TaxID=2057743 RepID=UPI0019D41DF4|nr:AAA family ATPase [Actinomyces wuliandei]
MLDSLRLVRQALGETLDNALRDRGGVKEVRRRSTGRPTSFTATIDFLESTGGAEGTYELQVGAVSGGGFRVAKESCTITSTEPGGGRHYYEIRGGEVVSTSEDRLPRLSADRLALVSLSGIEVFRPVYDGLSAMEVFSPSPEAMRRPVAPDPGDLLRRDGSNIASVIERLDRARPEVKRRIEDYLHSIVPGVESVRRLAVARWETLEFQQRVQGASAPWSFQATSVSDGTLRALGVLVALFAGADTTLSAVGVEEPETALHPAAAGVLLDAIRDASERRQVLLTTHSPDLLDSASIRPDELLAVRSVEGTTEVSRPDEASRMALKESLFTAGELLRADQLHPEVREVVAS